MKPGVKVIRGEKFKKHLKKALEAFRKIQVHKAKRARARRREQDMY